MHDARLNRGYLVGRLARKDPDGFGDIVPHQADNANDDENLQNLKRISRLNLGLDVLALGVALFAGCLGRGRGQGREAAVEHVLLHELVLLVPLVSQPLIKLVLVVEGHVGKAESSPVQVDRLGRKTRKVGTVETEKLLSVLAAPAKDQYLRDIYVAR